MANPAVAFLDSPRPPQAEGVVRSYADYLLTAAGARRLPVPLETIHSHFKIPVRRRSLAASGGQRGWTTPDLTIYVNSDDLQSVQNYTLAHELVELLFFALREGAADHWMDDDLFNDLLQRKETLCELGAAEIVLPLDLFVPLAEKQPFSLPYCRWLARECKVSLTATVRRLFDTTSPRALFVTWTARHAKKDRVPSAVGQMNFIGGPDAMDDAVKMRADYVLRSPSVGEFVPKGKSVPQDCVIHRAHRDGQPASGWDELDLGSLKGRFYVEAEPFEAEGERRVLSLIHLPQVEVREDATLPAVWSTIE